MLSEKTYRAFGVDEVAGEPHYHKHIRNIAINWACQAFLDTCVNATRDKVRELIDGKREQLSTEHESAILCNGVLFADMEEFDYMWGSFNSSSVPSKRRLYLESMGCIESEVILTRFINLILESDDIRSDEWLTIITAVYSNGPIGLSVALNFLR